MGATMPFSKINADPEHLEIMRAAFYRVCEILQLRSEDQRQGDEAAQAELQRSLRQSRPAGAERASKRALPICRVEALHGRAGLSRRGRRPLLLGAVRPVARDRRCA